jgi:hypothetical protein
MYVTETEKINKKSGNCHQTFIFKGLVSAPGMKNSGCFQRYIVCMHWVGEFL